MVKRSRRLKEGIKSLEKQVLKHRQKLEEARRQNKLDLAGYYEKEIQGFEKEILKKKKQMKLK
jgi:hypothetical protein